MCTWALQARQAEEEEWHLRHIPLLQEPDAGRLGLVWQLVQLDGPCHGHAWLHQTHTHAHVVAGHLELQSRAG